jgi:quercetin dioxygenase-like cupin family protein
MEKAERKETKDGGRPRENSEVLFTAPMHELDLRAVASELAVGQAKQGRRQKALYHYGRLTIVLFTFELGSGIPDHVAHGVVTINVLDGRLRVKAAGVEHDLTAGKLLVLAPGVRHDVAAEEASTMLLQIYSDDATRE